MRKLLLRWAIGALAVYVATRIVNGIYVGGGWLSYLWVALVLGLVNAVVAPIIKLLTCPLRILSLGVFTLVINAAMLLLVSKIVPEFVVRDFGAAFVGAIIISVVSLVLSVITGAQRKDHREGSRR